MALNIGRERKPITVLFADVVDSTGMAEAMDPEDWAATMNSAFDLMSQAVQQYDGTVAQFLGDGILAFFGAPVAHEDDPQRAVWAALRMLESAATIASELGAGDEGLRIRVGINTGPVILGQVGNLQPGTYSAMGDTLNTAARVQSAADPDSVAVTDTTYRLVSDVFEGDDLGEIRVKGKAAPVHCYRITGPRPAVAGVPPGVLDAPFIGRKEEVARLRALIAAAGKGRGGAVFVTGEPGIGKSRLITEARGAASEGESEPLWLDGRAVSYGAGVPYGLALQVVRSMFGTGLATEPAEGRDAVTRTLTNLMGSGATESYPYIAHLLSLPVPADGLPERIEPEHLQNRYAESLVALLEAAARRRPVVVVCEDLHWADPSSVALLAKVIGVARHARVLFVFSLRRDPQSPGWRLLTEARDVFGEALTDMRLDPLSPGESAAFAEQLLGASPPESLRKFLFEITEGNPLFIEEVVRTYVSSAPLSDGDWGAPPRGSVLEGSYSLHSLLLSSIDRLPEDARRVLRVASAIGREFSVDLLTTAVRELDEVLDAGRQLSLLEASGLLALGSAHPELQYSFRHALLLDAAYGSLLKSDRKRLHAAIGAALETVYPHRTEELAGLLARHFGEAGDESRTFTYSVLAADAAFSRYATAEAATHYGRAVEIGIGVDPKPDRLGELFLRLGRSLELTDRYDEAVGTYRRLEELGRDRGDRRLELAGLAAGATALATPAGKQDIVEAERLAGRALALAREVGDRAAESRSLWNLMLAHNFGGRDPGSAIRFGEEALAMARESENAEQVASTLLDLHWSYLAAGRIDDSLATLDEAIALWRELGDRAMLADSLSSLSGLHLLVGDLEEVLTAAEDARIVAEQSGNLWAQSYCRMFSGYALRELGRAEEALEVMGECIRLAELSNTSAAQVGTRADLGLMLAQLGSAEEGLALAEQALEESGRRRGAFREWAAASLARVHVLMGNLDKAGSVLNSVDSETHGALIMPLPLRFPLGLARGELALARGAAERSMDLSRDLVVELERLGIKLWMPEALVLQARASAAMGDKDTALELVDRARSIAFDMRAMKSWQEAEALLDELGKGLTT